MSGALRELPTSIGPPLVFDGEVWSIDVGNVPTLHGLSVLSLALNARLGHELPIVLLGDTGAAALPTPLAAALRIDEKTPSWQAKIVALAHRQKRVPAGPYRIGMNAHEKFGQWFEVGPANGVWEGAMLGVAGAAIDFHAVGPKGELPEKTVLEFATKDMKLALGADEYTAWSVQNVIDAEHSYFVRVKGAPASLLFGPLAQGDEAEVFVLKTG